MSTLYEQGDAIATALSRRAFDIDRIARAFETLHQTPLAGELSEIAGDIFKQTELLHDLHARWVDQEFQKAKALHDAALQSALAGIQLDKRPESGK